MTFRYTEERLMEVGYGYDLDTGGYRFEHPAFPELVCIRAMVWENPDSDYVPWIVGDDGPRSLPEIAAHSVTLYAFCPSGFFAGGCSWPERLEAHGDVFVLVRSGILYETDHDCVCDGGGCERCQEGWVRSEGGDWALYVLNPTDSGY